MASAIKLPTCSNKNPITFSESSVPKSHSFRQVSLPKRNELSPARHSLVASPGSFMPALTGIATGVGNSNRANTLTLPNFWRQIQGCNDWEGLLDPLHPLLRQEIIRYGEFATASYKAFELYPNSERYLNCKYGKKNMLREIGMENCGYQVTKYIYATPDINIPIQNSSSSGRWIGFVAVSSDEAVRRLGRRDIVITFRGTVTNHEWMANFMSSLTPAMLDPHNPRPDVKVESGFLSLYTSDESFTKFGLESCREQLLSEVSRLLNKYKGENNVSLTMTGHSMGSALALLLAYDITELGLNKKNRKPDIPVTVFSFGGPRVGNLEFKNRCEELCVKMLRIVNVNDPITKLPGVFLNENFRVLGGRYEFPWSCSCYAHVGVELMLDFFNARNPSCVHDLESYISLIRYPKLKDNNQLQIQKERVNHLMEKARELLVSTQNIIILPGVLAGVNLYGDQFGSVSMDIISSCGDALLFGLVLFFM